jgi:hypothetical protein
VRYAGLFSHPHSPNLVGEQKFWVALERARRDQVSHYPRGVEIELEHGALYGRNGAAGNVGRRNLAAGEDGRVHEGHRRCSTRTGSSTWGTAACPSGRISLCPEGRKTCSVLVVVSSAGVLTTSPLGFPNRATSALWRAPCVERVAVRVAVHGARRHPGIPFIIYVLAAK